MVLGSSPVAVTTLKDHRNNDKHAYIKKVHEALMKKTEVSRVLDITDIGEFPLTVR